MSTINDGGPMFPIPDREFANGNWIYGHSGASLRDWFAGQALNGVLSQSPSGFMSSHWNIWEAAGNREKHENTTFDRIAMFSYSMADAMLKARGQ